MLQKRAKQDMARFNLARGGFLALGEALLRESLSINLLGTRRSPYPARLARVLSLGNVGSHLGLKHSLSFFPFCGF